LQLPDKLFAFSWHSHCASIGESCDVELTLVLQQQHLPIFTQGRGVADGYK